MKKLLCFVLDHKWIITRYPNCTCIRCGKDGVLRQTEIGHEIRS